MYSRWHLTSSSSLFSSIWPHKSSQRPSITQTYTTKHTTNLFISYSKINMLMTIERSWGREISIKYKQTILILISSNVNNSQYITVDLSNEKRRKIKWRGWVSWVWKWNWLTVDLIPFCWWIGNSFVGMWLFWKGVCCELGVKYF